MQLYILQLKKILFAIIRFGIIGFLKMPFEGILYLKYIMYIYSFD